MKGGVVKRKHTLGVLVAFEVKEFSWIQSADLALSSDMPFLTTEETKTKPSRQHLVPRGLLIGLLKGETSYHGVTQSMRVASKNFQGKGKVSRGCMRAHEVEGGCEACLKLTVGKGNEPWYSQNDLLSAKMKVDPLLSYKVTQKVMKGSLKLDEGGVCTSEPPRDFTLDQWWETTKEQLGLMAHLQDIAPYHNQEQDLELSKVGEELLKVLKDVLGWLDLWVLEGYQSLKAVPLLKDWGIDYEEVPELSSEGWGSINCYLHQGQGIHYPLGLTILYYLLEIT
ncbi:hypothetical protein EDD16DRAFT_1520743 [Pisolithus croceorrhizus]|nr:hypothetical protein EDD16DRAFT_1520743 [Pisolithus croceorrhizus]